MGSCSHPIMTLCFDSNNMIIPKNKVVIDFSNEHASNILPCLESHNIIVTGVTSFDDSIMSTRYGTKINFATKDEIAEWYIYYKIVMSQNPDVCDIQSHFFCDDCNIPFVISQLRNHDTTVHVGISNHVFYSDVNFDIDPDEYPISFNEEKYKSTVLRYNKFFWYEMKLLIIRH